MTYNVSCGTLNPTIPTYLLFVCLSVSLSFCLSPKCKKTRFPQKLSNLELWCLLTTYRKSYMGFSNNPLRDPKIQDGIDPPSWMLSQNVKNVIFLENSNLELWCLLTTYRTLCNWAFKEPIIGSIKSKMAEIRHLENRHDVIFVCRGWSDLDKISEIGAD